MLNILQIIIKFMEDIFHMVLLGLEIKEKMLDMFVSELEYSKDIAQK